MNPATQTPTELSHAKHDKVMEQHIIDLTHKVDRISEALLGNEFNRDGGLVTIINDHEKRINKIEEAGVFTHDKRIKDLEDSAITQKLIQKVMIFIAGLVTAGVMSWILSLIFKK